MSPQTLKQLGRYQIEGQLGSGAYADVYKATDTLLDRVVALKVLKPALLADEDAFQRFLQEAKVLAKLMHPRIAWVWDLGEAEGLYYLAMRYVDGLSLDKVLAERGDLPWEEALQVISQVAEALEFAHNKGLIHRDVKPQNILVSLEEGAVLTDFGLVKAMQASGMSTRSGAIIGTPQYIAPEIWKGENATPATDQYALACVLVELLSGKALFDAPTPPAIMLKHFQPPELPAQWPEETPEMLPQMLQKALASEPDARFESPKAFLAVLKPTPAPRLQAMQHPVPTLPHQSKHAEDYYQRGLKFYNTGDYAQAIDAFTHAIEIDPDQANYYFERGTCYEVQEDYDEAIADLTSAIILDPYRADFYRERSVCYHNLENYKDAIADISEGILLDPDKAEDYRSRGLSYLEKGDYKRAIADFTKAISLDPNNAVYYMERGVSYRKKGDHRCAIDDFTQAILIAPDNIDYYQHRSLSYHENGNYNQAIADDTKVISIQPDLADHYYSRGLSRYNAGYYNQAIKDFTKAIELDPKNAEYYFDRAITYNAIGETAKAAADEAQAQAMSKGSST